MWLLVFIIMAVSVLAFNYEPNIWWVMALGMFYMGDCIYCIAKEFKKTDEEYGDWE